MVVIEVASPSTRTYDDTVKREGYFSLASVQHYLIVDPKRPLVIHYGRQEDGRIARADIKVGTLTLSPPGLELDVSEMSANGAK